MADSKITALTELTAVADGDLLPIVDDPSGTPVTRKITKANLFASLGLELDYVEFTSNVPVTATTEGGADVVVTGNSVAYDGSTPVIIEFWCENARPALTAGLSISFVLYEDGSSIGIIGRVATPAASINNQTVHAMRRMTPSNASHTYSIRSFVTSGSGLIGAGPGGSGNSMPGFIRIQKANP